MGSWLGQTGVEILELVNVRDRGWMRRMMDHGWDGGGIYLIPSRARRRPRDWQGARVIGVFRRFGTSTGSIDGIKICPIRHLVTVEQSRSYPGSLSLTVPFFSLSLSPQLPSISSCLTHLISLSHLHSERRLHFAPHQRIAPLKTASHVRHHPLSPRQLGCLPLPQCSRE